MHFLIFSAFSAVLLIFSFPAADIGFFAWIALIPFFFVIQEAPTDKKALLYSFISGFVFWGGLIYWLLFLAGWSMQTWLITILVFLGYLGLTAILAFFTLLFGWGCRLFKKRAGLSFIWSAPLLWVGLEYLRTHLFSGFPWGLIGASQYKCLPVIQIAEWTGVYGVSFVAVLVNAFLFEGIDFVLGRRKKLSLPEKIIPLLVFGLTLLFGMVSLKQYSGSNREPAEGARISLVQGNIPQDVKWSDEYEETIHQVYRDLTLSAVEKENPDLVIWPETAIPAYLKYDEESLKFVSGLIKKIKKPMLVGASDAQSETTEKNGKFKHAVYYYNSAFLLQPGIGFTKQYNKIHLVPFGEFNPFTVIPFVRKLIPLEEDYAPGKEYTVFDFKVPFSTVICFEDIFPDLVRRYVKNGARCLINMTNDGWFKNSSAPMQHAALSVFRSVENRVWLVRATNTGVSCFVSPAGKIVSQIEDNKGKNIWISGSLTGTVFPGNKKTFYTQAGDLFSWLVLSAVVILLLRHRKTIMRGYKNGAN